MPSLIRTFVALPLSRHAAEGFVSIQREIAHPEDRINWVAPSQFHITLRFLGDIPEADIPRVVEAVDRSVGARGCLTLFFQGVGTFPNWTRPRVLWCRVSKGDSELVEVAHAVQASLIRLTPGEDVKALHPHVTLGRVKRLSSRERLRDATGACARIRIGPEKIDRVVVYGSTLTAKGPIYSVLGSVSL